MNKLVLFVAILLTVSSVYAEDGILKDLPNIKQGFGYSLADINGDNEIISLTTADIAIWQGFSVGAGIATELDNDNNINPAVTLNYKIGNLEKWGVKLPLNKYVDIDLGLFASKDLNDEHTNWGVQGSLIKVKL